MPQALHGPVLAGGMNSHSSPHYARTVADLCWALWDLSPVLLDALQLIGTSVYRTQTSLANCGSIIWLRMACDRSSLLMYSS